MKKLAIAGSLEIALWFAWTCILVVRAGWTSANWEVWVLAALMFLRPALKDLFVEGMKEVFG